MVCQDDEIAALKAELAAIRSVGKPSGTLEEWRTTLGQAMDAWFLSVDAVRAGAVGDARLSRLHDEARGEVSRVRGIIQGHWFGGKAR
jgi:hypothetical protein